MSAKVILENVGGLPGSHEFEFARGAINIVKAPSASGKTTLLKALALCLSAPFRSEISIEIARRMGILRRPGEPIEPLVHMGSEKAKIVIKLDQEEWSCELSKDGKLKVLREGDDRFLITSIVARSSEVVRRLTEGDTDFSWILSNVSLASKYESMLNAIEEVEISANDLLYSLESSKDELESLKTEIKDIERRIEELRKKEHYLNSELSKMLEKHPEVENLKQKRDSILNAMEALKEERSRILRELEDLNGRERGLIHEHEAKLVKKEQLEKEIRERSKELSLIERDLELLAKELSNFELRLNEINEEEKRLRFEEGKAYALVEMYKRVAELVKSGRKIRCFLCEQGYITPEKIEQRRSIAEKQLSGIRDKIARLIQERNRLLSKLNKREELKGKRETLKREIRQLHGQLSNLLPDIKRFEDELNAIRMQKNELEYRLNEIDKELENYEKELAHIEEILGTVGEEERKLANELSEVRGRLRELNRVLEERKRRLLEVQYVSVAGFKLPLDLAYKLISSWLECVREVSERLRIEAYQEKIMALESFNEAIKNVLKEVGFEYLDVWIGANDYRLHVMDKRVGKEVSPRILSETERYVLALVIHIALKVAYARHLPFFIIDEVILSFDERRKRAMLAYLETLSKEFEWIVIVSELGRTPSIVVEAINP